MKKKNIILLIIAIVMFILVGSTMAYFGWSSSAENKDQLVDVTVAGGTGSCDKLSDNNKLLYPTSTREKGRILKVTTKQQMATNAFVTWNLVVNSINETTLTTSGLKHKSFKYELVNDTTGVSYGTGSFENVTNGTTITLSTDKETLDYNKEYTFILYLWIDGTIGNNPLDMTNRPYNFDLNCNITGTSTKVTPPAPTNMVQYIRYLYNNAEKKTATNNGKDYNTAPSVSLMNDRLGGTTTDLDGGNIRYYGASPKNYIYFNCSDYSNQTSSTCETWRIIGVFDGKLKLIRGSQIGAYAWDNKNTTTGAESSNGKNDWTTARLMKLLNPSDYYEVDSNDNNLGQSLYYNSASGKCYRGQNNATVDCDFTSTGIKNDTTRNMIAETTYNLGGWNTFVVYPNEIYEYERGTTVYTGRPTTTWTGKIALAYPSDYGYAADLNQCKQTLANYDNSTCTSNNWMKSIITNNGSYVGWLLTPYSSSSNRAWYVFWDGNVYNDNYAYFMSVAVPVLSLSSELGIKSGSGDGSSSNPYKLSA